MGLSFLQTSSSAVADEPARRSASRQMAKFKKQSHDHSHAPFVGDHAHFRDALTSVAGTCYVQPTYQISNVYDNVQRGHERQRQM